jgi:hypothetical protein
MEHIVEGDNCAFRKERPKSIEISFRPAIGVVAVNPQQPQGPVPRPLSCHVGRKRFVELDVFRNARPFQI